MSGIKSAFIIYVLILKNLSESAAEVHLFYQFQYWSVRLKRYRIKLNVSAVKWTLNMTTAQVVEMSKHTSKFKLDLESMGMFKRVLKNSKEFCG